jgi:predicted nucleic acid-binding protein
VILVDTSVWVAHLRYGNTGIESFLNDGQIACHPFIIGELACGNLTRRALILSLLKKLPMAISAEHEEIMNFIESYSLTGKGLGFIDVHLIASALLSKVSIWTIDMKLKRVCSLLRIAH